MKIRLIYFFISLSAVFLGSCDYVKPNDDFTPGAQAAQDTSTCLSAAAPALSGSNFAVRTNTAVSGFRKVLIEDYTGQKCGNCPPAATTAENISNQYKDSVVILAVHAGGFAVPFGAIYSADYRTPAGDQWDGSSGFNVSANGNPNGMVNRTGYLTNTHVKAYTTWGSLVSQIGPYKKGQGIKLNITTNYDTVQRLLNVDVKPVFLKNYGDTVINLSVVLSEDSIVGPQKDYSKTPDDVLNYVFMNMMRGSLNGTWGDALTKCTWYKRGFSVNTAYNDKFIHLIAFAYYANSKEIIQVEKVKIR